MTKRKPGETIEQFAIRSAFCAGHFWAPDNVAGWAIRSDDLKNLSASDPVVIAALRSYSQSDADMFTRLVLKHHGRRPTFDGEVGPALQEFAEASTQRCAVPDFAPPMSADVELADKSANAVAWAMQANEAQPAQGSGNWEGCHGIGNFHCAVARWDLTRKPRHLPDERFQRVLALVQRAYADLGLLWRFVGPNMIDLVNGEDLGGLSVNTECSFVNSSDGWIGLAIVGRNETCQSNIWARFLGTFTGGESDASIVNQWFSLIAHELGHNCGRLHTNGGIMNPSLIRGLDMTWRGDPSENWLVGQFGGQPVPIPGDPAPPGPQPPKPPVSIEDRVRRNEIKNAVQDATLDYLVQKVRTL